VQVFVGPVTEREQKIPFKKEPVKFGWCHSWLVINPCTGPKRTYEMPNIDYENQPAFRSLYMESLQMTPEQLASTRKIIPMGFQLWKNLPHEPPLAKGTRLVCTVEDECCKPEGPITPSGESPYPMDCCSLLNDGTMKHSWTLSAVLGPGNPPTQANCNVFTATAMALCGVTWTHESDLTGAEGAKEIANTEAGTPFGSGGKCIIPSCMAGADIASLFTFFGKRIGR
jgi:hypothetical protein